MKAIIDGKTIIINDPVEIVVLQYLEALNIKYEYEKEIEDGKRLDFFLSDYDVFIECKRFYSPRAIRQLENKKVILVQSLEAAHFLLATIGLKP